MAFVGQFQSNKSFVTSETASAWHFRSRLRARRSRVSLGLHGVVHFATMALLAPCVTLPAQGRRAGRATEYKDCEDCHQDDGRAWKPQHSAEPR